MAETKIKEQGIAGGVIVQVASATYSTTTSTSSTSFVDTGLSLNFTPKYANSKILINIKTGEIRSGAASNGAEVALFRDTTNIYQVCKYASYPTNDLRSYATGMYVDEPNTTSQVTYKTQFRRSAGTSGAVTHCEDSSTSNIVIMEIKQ